MMFFVIMPIQILTDLQKFMPENEVIGATHANTGYTDFYHNIIFKLVIN